MFSKGLRYGRLWSFVGSISMLGPVLAVESIPEGFAHLYVAQVTDTRFVQAARLDVDLQDSRLISAGVGRRLRHLGEDAQMEWEVQITQHWGMQRHPEASAMVAARWQRFPWERYVSTSAAFGAGVSQAFGPPTIESDEGDDRTLIYLMLEVTAASPRNNRWSVFARIHHRSGFFERLVDAGSNFVGFGIRRHFD